MKDFFLKVLAVVMGAAIVANVTMLFRFSERLTRIETKIEMAGTKVAKND